MEEQRNRARAAQKKEIITLSDIGSDHPTVFVGYDALATQAKVAQIAKIKDRTAIILDKSPCYAEMGGQVGDAALVTLGGRQWHVTDTQKSGQTWLHFLDGEDAPEAGATIEIAVDQARRDAIQRLSRLRRHRAAGPILLIFALFTIGTTFQVASAVNNESTSIADRAVTIEEGKQIFLKGCSSCHGLNAEGGQIAPSLIGVGAASVDFQVATGRMPMADMSVQAMRKDPVYNAEQVHALATYVASLAPGPQVPGEELLNYERDGSVAEGGELFRTNCAMCHNFAAQGGALTQGKYAPTLMGVEPRHIYEAMVTGPQSMPVFSDKTITPEEKLSIIKWIKAAEAEPQLGGAALGRVGPVTEGLLVWTLGIGLLIGVAVWLAMKAR
jgi:ubiquinol-cytochrome c reductase cytochrome c subunit